MLEAKELRHPQITETQLELWLADPVTQIYLEAMQWRHQDSVEAAGKGKITDSSSADLTHAMIHVELGKQHAYQEAAFPEAVLEFYRVIYHPPPEDTDE